MTANAHTLPVRAPDPGEAGSPTSPEFVHAVPAQPFSSSPYRNYSTIFYGGRSRHGFDFEALEFNYLAKNDSHAIARCRFEAGYQKRTHCKIRDPHGVVIYDGRSELREEPAQSRENRK